jgi:alpha-tubulin suppressor-like RCC1 family protein
MKKILIALFLVATPAWGDVLDIAAGSYHTCAITDSCVRCWGSNIWGESDVPNNLCQSSQVIQIDLDERQTCALTAGGEVKCWGDDRPNHGVNVPRDLGTAYQIATGWLYSCAHTDRGVRCWGWDRYGQTYVPAELRGSIDVRQMDAGQYHACAVTGRGDIHCWGSNGYGQTTVPEDLGFTKQVAVGGFHTCAITNEGLRCWGLNSHGETNVPDDISLPDRVVQVEAGIHHSCALTNNGEVRCWGWNQADRTTVPEDLGRAVKITVGDGHNCALLANGRARCWGPDNMGNSDVPLDL